MTLDQALKLGALLATLVGLFWGVQKFNTEYKLRSIEEFRRNIWKEKLNSYKETGETVSKVVNASSDTNQALFDEYVNDFQQLYWGNMILLQDTTVEQYMKKFNDEIRSHYNGESCPDSLRMKGSRLIKKMRTSLKDSWDSLSTLDTERCSCE